MRHTPRIPLKSSAQPDSPDLVWVHHQTLNLLIAANKLLFRAVFEAHRGHPYMISSWETSDMTPKCILS